MFQTIKKLQLITWFTVCSYVFSSVLDPASAHALTSELTLTARALFQPPNLSLPAELGQVEKVVWNREQPKPVIFHLVDAHTSLDAQKQIVSILNYLRQHDQLSDVGIEGAAGDLEPRRLNGGIDSKQRAARWDSLMEKGWISGGVRFLLDHQRLPAFGLEDTGLYRENFESARKILRHKAEARKFMDAFQVRLDQASRAVLSQETRLFVEQWKSRFKPDPDWPRYFDQLFGLSAKHLGIQWENSEAQTKFPMMVRMYQVMRLQSRLDLAKAEKELQQLQRIFAHDPLAHELQRLRDVWLWSKQGAEQAFFQKRSFRDTAEKIMDGLWGKGRTFYRYPHLKNWLAYQALVQEVEASELDQEMRRLEESLLEALARSSKEKQLIRFYHFLFLLEAGVRLEMTPFQVREWNALLDTLKLSTMEVWAGARYLSPAGGLLKLTRDIRDFYQFVDQRDQAFAQKVFDRFQAQPGKAMAVITGGFHQKGFEEAVRRHSISYVLIRPNFNPKGGEIPYAQRLLGNPVQAATLQLPQTFVMRPELVSAMTGLDEETETPAAQGHALLVPDLAGRSEIRNVSRRTFITLTAAGFLGTATAAQADGFWGKLWPFGGRGSQAPSPYKKVIPHSPSPFAGKDRIEISIEDLDRLILSDILLQEAEHEYQQGEIKRQNALGWKVSADFQPVIEDGRLKMLMGANLDSAYGGVSVFGINAGLDWTSAIKSSFDIARALLGGYKNDKALLEEGARFQYLRLQQTFLERRNLAMTLWARIATQQELIRMLDTAVTFLEKTAIPATQARERADAEAPKHLSRLIGQLEEAKKWRTETAQRMDENSKDLRLMITLSGEDLGKPIQPKGKLPQENSLLAMDQVRVSVDRAVGPLDMTEEQLAKGEIKFPRNRSVALQLSSIRLAWLAQKKIRLSRISLNGLLGSFFDAFGRPDRDAQVRQRIGQSSLIPEIRDRGYAKTTAGMRTSMVLGGSAWKSFLFQGAAQWDYERVKGLAVSREQSENIDFFTRSQRRWFEAEQEVQKAFQDQKNRMRALGLDFGADGNIGLTNPVLPLHDLAAMLHVALEMQMEISQVRYNRFTAELGLFTLGALQPFRFTEEQLQGPPNLKTPFSPVPEGKGSPLEPAPASGSGGKSRRSAEDFFKPVRSELRKGISRYALNLAAGVLLSAAAILPFTSQAEQSRPSASVASTAVSGRYPDLESKVTEAKLKSDIAEKNWGEFQEAKKNNPYAFTEIEMGLQRAEFETLRITHEWARLDLEFAEKEGPEFVKQNRHHIHPDFVKVMQLFVSELEGLSKNLNAVKGQPVLWAQLTPLQRKAAEGFLGIFGTVENLASSGKIYASSQHAASASSAQTVSAGHGDLDHILSLNHAVQRMQALENYWDKHPRPEISVFQTLIEHGQPEIAHAALMKLVTEKAYSQLFELRRVFREKYQQSLSDHDQRRWIWTEAALIDSLAGFPDLSALDALTAKDPQVKQSIENFIVSRLSQDPQDSWALFLLQYPPKLFEESEFRDLISRYPHLGNIFYNELARKVAIRLTRNQDYDAVGKKITDVGVLFTKGAESGMWIDHNRHADMRQLLMRGGDGSVLRWIHRQTAEDALETLRSLLGDVKFSDGASPGSASFTPVKKDFFYDIYEGYWKLLGDDQKLTLLTELYQAQQWQELIRVLDFELHVHPPEKTLPPSPVISKILNMLAHHNLGRLWVASYLAEDFSWGPQVLAFQNGQGSLRELLDADLRAWGNGKQREESSAAVSSNAWQQGASAAMVHRIYENFLQAKIQHASGDQDKTAALAYWLSIQPSEFELGSFYGHPFLTRFFPLGDIQSALQRELERRTTTVAAHILKLRRSSNEGVYVNDVGQDIYEFILDALDMKYASDHRGMLSAGSREKTLQTQFPGKEKEIRQALQALDEMAQGRIQRVQKGEREALKAGHFLQSLFQSVSGIPAVLISLALLVASGLMAVLTVGNRFFAHRKNQRYFRRIEELPRLLPAGLRDLAGDLQSMERHFSVGNGQTKEEVQVALQTWFSLVQKDEITLDDVDQAHLLFKAVVYHEDNRLTEELVAKANKDHARRRDTMHILARLITLTIEKLMVQYQTRMHSGKPLTDLEKQDVYSKLEIFKEMGLYATHYMEGLRALDDVYEYTVFYPEEYVVTEPDDRRQQAKAWINDLLIRTARKIRASFGIDSSVNKNLNTARQKFLLVFDRAEKTEEGLYSAEDQARFDQILSQPAEKFFEKKISAYGEQGNRYGSRIRRFIYSRAFILYSIASYLSAVAWGLVVLHKFVWEFFTLLIPVLGGFISWIAHWWGNHAGQKSFYYRELQYRFEVLDHAIKTQVFNPSHSFDPLQPQIEETVEALRHPPKDLQVILIRSPDLKNPREWKEVQQSLIERQIVPKGQMKSYDNAGENGELSLVMQAMAQFDARDPGTKKVFLLISPGSLDAAAVTARPYLPLLNGHTRLDFAIGNAFRIHHTLPLKHLNIIAAAGRDRYIPVGSFDRRGLLTVAGVSMSQEETIALSASNPGLIGMQNHTGINPYEVIRRWHQSPRDIHRLSAELKDWGPWVDAKNTRSKQLIGFAEVMVFSTDDEREWNLIHSSLQKIHRVIEVINADRRKKGEEPFPFDLEWEFLVTAIRAFQDLSSNEKNPMGHEDARLRDFPAEERDAIGQMFGAIYRNIFDLDKLFFENDFGDTARELNQLKLTEEEIRALAVHISMVHPLFSSLLKMNPHPSAVHPGLQSGPKGGNGNSGTPLAPASASRVSSQTSAKPNPVRTSVSHRPPPTFVNPVSAGTAESVSRVLNRPALAGVQKSKTPRKSKAKPSKKTTLRKPATPLELTDDFFERLPAEADEVTGAFYKVVPVEMKVLDKTTRKYVWQKKYMTLYGSQKSGQAEPVWNGTPTFADIEMLKALKLFKDGHGKLPFRDIEKLADASVFILTDEKPDGIPKPVQEIMSAVREGRSIDMRKPGGRLTLASGVRTASITKLRRGRSLRLAQDFSLPPTRSEMRSPHAAAHPQTEVLIAGLALAALLSQALDHIAEHEVSVRAQAKELQQAINQDPSGHELVADLRKKVEKIAQTKPHVAGHPERLSSAATTAAYQLAASAAITGRSELRKLLSQKGRTPARIHTDRVARLYRRMIREMEKNKAIETAQDVEFFRNLIQENPYMLQGYRFSDWLQGMMAVIISSRAGQTALKDKQPVQAQTVLLAQKIGPVLLRLYPQGRRTVLIGLDPARSRLVSAEHVSFGIRRPQPLNGTLQKLHGQTERPYLTSRQIPIVFTQESGTDPRIAIQRQSAKRSELRVPEPVRTNIPAVSSGPLSEGKIKTMSEPFSELKPKTGVSVSTLRAALEILERILPADLRGEALKTAIAQMEALAQDAERTMRRVMDEAGLETAGISAAGIQTWVHFVQRAQPVLSGKKLILDAAVLSDEELIQMAKRFSPAVILISPSETGRIRTLQSELAKIPDVLLAETEQPRLWIQKAYQKDPLGWDPDQFILIGAAERLVRPVSPEMVAYRWVLKENYLRGQSFARYQALAMLLNHPDFWAHRSVNHVQNVAQMVASYLEQVLLIQRKVSTAA